MTRTTRSSHGTRLAIAAIAAVLLSPATGAQDAAPPATSDGKALEAWTYLAARYDADGDGRIVREEYTRGDAAFARLDRDGDGALTQADLASLRPSAEEQAQRDGLAARALALLVLQEDRERDVLLRDELRAALTAADGDVDGVLGHEELTARVGRDAARRLPAMLAALLAGRDGAALILAAADADGDATLTIDEGLAWFDAHDPGASGRWTVDGVRRDMMALGPPGGPGASRTPPESRGPRGPRGTDGPGAPEGRGERAGRADAAEGPTRAVQGLPAPDFSLPREHGGETITLSSFRDDRPVALIFGSFT